MDASDSALLPTLKALRRMRRAYERGTGCYLTPEMIANMGISRFGEMWHEDDSCLERQKRVVSFKISGTQEADDGR